MKALVPFDTVFGNTQKVAEAIAHALGSLPDVELLRPSDRVGSRLAGLNLSAKATITYTSSGFSSMRAARERPEAPILSLTPHESTAPRLALVWGVHSVFTMDTTDINTMTDLACRTAVHEGFAKPGDNVVIAAGVPFGQPGTTNLLRIAKVRADCATLSIPGAAAGGPPERG